MPANTDRYKHGGQATTGRYRRFLSERRAQRARQAFDDASRGMREAEQALFETLRHAYCLEQSARAKRAKRRRRSRAHVQAVIGARSPG